MKENAYDLLIFVYEEFIGTNYWSLPYDDREEAFLKTFYEAGYDDDDIERYIDWFDFTFAECDLIRNQDDETSFVELEPKRYASALKRTYSHIEHQRIGKFGPLFLDTLFAAEFINLSQREFIIERALAIDTAKNMNLDQLKWLTLMIITNQNKDYYLDPQLHQLIINWQPKGVEPQNFFLH